MHVFANTGVGVGEFLLWCLWVFLFIVWFWLLISVFSDLFRRHDIHGLGKAFWIIFVVVLPFLGVFAYIITQSKGMAERNVKAVKDQREALRQMVGVSPADELLKLDQLKASGSITPAEYDKMRAEVVG
ncbi:MAG: SHOCT domain-containing protein [Actinomycetes bacterium]